MFFALGRLATKNLMLNIKCEPKPFVDVSIKKE